MKAQSICVLMVIAGIAAYLFHACKPDWQFSRLEMNARKAITPAQLQTWATNLLATFPTNATRTPKAAALGTNFPAQLLPLYHRPPSVLIQEATKGRPASVYLAWGGGLIGHCGFEIGSPEFVSYRQNARAWQPGVYFWSDRGRERGLLNRK